MREDVHGSDEPADERPGTRDRELGEKETKLPLERVAQLLARALRQVPEILFERADRLLSVLVEELRLRLSAFPVGSVVAKDPPLDHALQGQREGRVLVDHVLETRR